MSESPTRPVLRYHGSKFRVADWVIEHFPPHVGYVEPYAGGASVLMRKPRSSAECLNDLDDRIVNLFRILRDPARALELQRRLVLTPFARSEFEAAYEKPADEIDAAHKLICLSFMGRGTDTLGRNYRTGFRSKLSDTRAFPSNEWATWPRQIPLFIERLQGVAIENRDALEVIQRLDSPNTLIYADPPYPRATRKSFGRQGYRHEMTDDQHRDLAEVLRKCEGMVVVSSYPSALYDELYGDWSRDECQARADGNKPRIEVIWMNPACWNTQRQLRLA